MAYIFQKYSQSLKNTFTVAYVSQEVNKSLRRQYKLQSDEALALNSDKISAKTF